MTAKELREKRAALVPQIRAMADKVHAESRDFTPEEKPNWEKLNKDYDALTVQIDILERTERLESDQSQRVENNARIGRDDRDSRTQGEAVTEEHRALALQAWCLTQEGVDLNERQEDACRRTGTNPRARELELNLSPSHLFRNIQREARAMSAFSPTAGGYTVPTGFVNSLERAMLQFGGVRLVAEVMRTDSGNDMPWPTANDTSNTGELINENTTVSTQDVTVAQILFRAYKWSSKLVKVPIELLQDSAFDVASLLGSMLGERLARAQNTYFTTGTGANQPRGIVTASTLGVTAASATAVTFDEILGLIHSVDPAYRAESGVGFMFHDSILLAVRKLKDGQSRYLWDPAGPAGGKPATLWGYPYTINQDMQSSLATGTKTFLFGALNKYKVRDVGQIRLRRLVERYADADQEGFVAFARGDGNLLDSGVAPVKHLIQA